MPASRTSTEPAAAFVLLSLLCCSPRPATADCASDARALRLTIGAERDDIVRRAAMAVAISAEDEAGDADEPGCRHYLERAQKILTERPFRVDPGQSLGGADDRRPIHLRPDAAMTDPDAD